MGKSDQNEDGLGRFLLREINFGKQKFDFECALFGYNFRLGNLARSKEEEPPINRRRIIIFHS